VPDTALKKQFKIAATNIAAVTPFAVFLSFF